MDKKVGCTLILSLMMFIGVGCGQKPLSDSGAQTVLGSTNNQEVSATASNDKVKEESQKIQVYFTDPQAMELKEAEDEIQFANNIEKYQKAFKALQNDSNPDLISLWSKMELKTISFNAGMVMLDIHMPDEARLGAGGEQFALESLKNTLFQFDEVTSIELLVDGESVESLMGHADLEHPMLRD